MRSHARKMCRDPMNAKRPTHGRIFPGQIRSNPGREPRPGTVPPHRSLVSLSRRGLRDPGTVTALDAHARRQAASRPDIGCPRRYLICVRTLPESAGPFQFSSSIGSHDKTADDAQAQPFLRCVLTQHAARVDDATRARQPRPRVVSSRFGGESRARRQKPASQNRTVCLRRLLSDQQRRRYFRQRAARLRAAACCTLHALEALTPGRPGVPPPVRPLPPSRTELVDRESPDHAIGEEDARD